MKSLRDRLITVVGVMIELNQSHYRLFGLVQLRHVGLSIVSSAYNTSLAI